VKLSERASLSGKPEFLRPAPVVQTSAPVLRRKCCMCGKPDVVQTIEGEPDHSVAVELKFVTAANEDVAKAMVTPRMAARGWRYKLHLGRHALERDICRVCLLAHREIQHEFAAKRSSELKSSTQSESYYLALCGD
jgi:hypothetical protein